MQTALILLILGAGAHDTLFEAGVDAYQARDYPAAIAAFEQLASNHAADAAVYHNLGNAYYRGGRIGPAIANYERALQLNPRMAAATENLRRAINETERAMPRPPDPAWRQALFFWDHWASARDSLLMAGGFWIAAWVLLAVRLFRPIPYARGVAVALFAAALAFAGSYWVRTHPPVLAVATSSPVPAYYGTSTDTTLRFELYEGDRVRVLERDGDWLRISTFDDERGWVQSDSVITVAPGFAPVVSQRRAKQAGRMRAGGRRGAPAPVGLLEGRSC